MEKLWSNFLKSFGAGLAIAIGALLYINIGGGVAGAIMFSIGIYLVLWFGLNLYTGKIGYINSYKDIPNILLIIIGNLIGCALTLISPATPFVISITAAKLAQPLYIIFIKAIICGILIYAGVDQYKKQKEYAPILAIPAFILAGAEHSIADACYFIAARAFSLEVVIFILIVIIGNAIGSLLWRFLT